MVVLKMVPSQKSLAACYEMYCKYVFNLLLPETVLQQTN